MTVFIHGRPIIIIQQIKLLLDIFLLHHRFYHTIPGNHLAKQVLIIREVYPIDYTIFYSSDISSGFFLRHKLRKRGCKLMFKLETGYIFLAFCINGVCLYSANGDKPDIAACFIFPNKKITFFKLTGLKNCAEKRISSADSPPVEDK